MSGYTGPDWQGTLIELESGHGTCRCRVGHAWSAEALHAAQGHELQRTLWTALRSLNDRTSLTTALIVRDGCTRWGVDDLTGEAAMVATELVENALKHTNSDPASR